MGNKNISLSSNHYIHKQLVVTSLPGQVDGSALERPRSQQSDSFF